MKARTTLAIVAGDGAAAAAALGKDRTRPAATAAVLCKKPEPFIVMTCAAERAGPSIAKGIRRGLGQVRRDVQRRTSSGGHHRRTDRTRRSNRAHSLRSGVAASVRATGRTRPHSAWLRCLANRARGVDVRTGSKRQALHRYRARGGELGG